MCRHLSVQLLQALGSAAGSDAQGIVKPIFLGFDIILQKARGLLQFK